MCKRDSLDRVAVGDKNDVLWSIYQTARNKGTYAH